MKLKERFQELTSKYIANSVFTERLWNELESSYSYSGRHYHTLAHLEQMLSELQQVQTMIKDWNTVLFALFYHDIIYKPTGSYNEKKAQKLQK